MVERIWPNSARARLFFSIHILAIAGFHQYNIKKVSRDSGVVKRISCLSNLEISGFLALIWRRAAWQRSLHHDSIPYTQHELWNQILVKKEEYERQLFFSPFEKVNVFDLFVSQRVCDITHTPLLCVWFKAVLKYESLWSRAMMGDPPLTNPTGKGFVER